MQRLLLIMMLIEKRCSCKNYCKMKLWIWVTRSIKRSIWVMIQGVQTFVPISSIALAILSGGYAMDGLRIRWLKISSAPYKEYDNKLICFNFNRINFEHIKKICQQMYVTFRHEVWRASSPHLLKMNGFAWYFRRSLVISCRCSCIA